MSGIYVQAFCADVNTQTKNQLGCLVTFTPHVAPYAIKSPVKHAIDLLSSEGQKQKLEKQIKNFSAPHNLNSNYRNSETISIVATISDLLRGLCFPTRQPDSTHILRFT
jgi:hypothetical protein